METEVQLELPLKELDDAAPEAKQMLQEAKDKNGFIANLYRIMANHPGLLKAYTQLDDIFRKDSVLDKTEQEVVLLSTSYVNNCHYCMSAHSTIADMQDVPKEVTDAIRRGNKVPDSKLEALHRFTMHMVEKDGWPKEEEIERFLDAGYTQEHILNVIQGIGLKTMSNYTNHIAHTPIDESFKDRVWAARQ